MPLLTELIISKTSEYLTIPAVVGYEHFFMDYLEQDFKALGLNAYQYQGLLQIEGTTPNNAILCAHLDRHGLISLGDNEYVYAAQYIREIKYGENNQSSRAQVEGIADRFEGEKIYAYHPEYGEHIAEGSIVACYPNRRNDDALFMIDGIAQLEPNIPLAYARQARYEDGKLKGQIDNVLSIATVYALYKAGYQGSALLTCEEEIGKSWIHIGQYLEGSQIETQNLLVIDTSPYKTDALITEGPVVLRNRDKSETFNPTLVNALKQRCESLNLPYRIKDERMLAEGKTIDQLGSTELGRIIQGTEGRWSGATVQIPTLSYHTSNETTTENAIENYFKFLEDILIKNPMEMFRI